MERIRERRSLINEAIASIPSYMQLSREQQSDLFNSFTNIFKVGLSSLKLLGQTLVLNLNVIQASFSKDRAKMQAAFDQFGESRKEYDEKMEKDLKYFRDFYYGDGVDTLGGFGPKVLAFAANPLLPFMAPGEKQKIGSVKVAAGDTTSTVRAAAGSYSPRVSRALDFFGYGGSGRISEQKTMTKTSTISPEMRDEAKKLQTIARGFVESEKKHAEQLLQQIGGRPALVKKVAEAKNFEELDAALKAAPAAGVKLVDKNIMSVKKKVEGDLLAKQKEDPKAFAAEIAKLRKQFPDVKEGDDVRFATLVAFGSAKSQVQNQLTATYNEMVTSAARAMKLPIDQATRAKLGQTDIGREYLGVVDNFMRAIETGSQQVAAAPKK